MNAADVTNIREYHIAMRRVFELMELDPAEDTPEGEELTRIVESVERFERAHYPIACCVCAAGDCAARLLALIRKLDAFYDLEQAVQWCETEQPMLDGQRPVDMLMTEDGAADVNALVARLRDNVQL